MLSTALREAAHPCRDLAAPDLPGPLQRDLQGGLEAGRHLLVQACPQPPRLKHCRQQLPPLTPAPHAVHTPAERNH